MMDERADRADCYNWVAFTGFDLDLKVLSDVGFHLETFGLFSRD